MSWLLRDNWLGSLLAFVVGAGITWLLLDRRRPAPAGPQPAAHNPEPASAPNHLTPPAAPPTAKQATPAPTAEPAQPISPVGHAPAGSGGSVGAVGQPVFSQLMGGEETLFDHIQPAADTASDAPADVPAGRYGEGSADAVPHQGPPDGFTIKGNAQSMLFHTPDSPYYGRTKPEVWFRTEADAERAGFTKYTRRPRKAADPRD
ncbi:sunset domain-containing protein [Kribbella sp. NPDC055110]